MPPPAKRVIDRSFHRRLVNPASSVRTGGRGGDIVSLGFDRFIESRVDLPEQEMCRGLGTTGRVGRQLSGHFVAGAIRVVKKSGGGIGRE